MEAISPVLVGIVKVLSAVADLVSHLPGATEIAAWTRGATCEWPSCQLSSPTRQTAGGRASTWRGLRQACMYLG